MSKAMLEGLNPQQKVAVTHEGGPLLVLAGAGSGKTRVITYRYAHVARKSGPSSILAITFTNKAANEMKGRISSLLKKDLKGAWIGTFHSQCSKILRREVAALGYKPDFSIYDKDDQHNLVRHILKEMNLYEALYKGIMSRIGALKSEAVTPEEFLANGDSFGFEERLARVYVRYQDELKRCNALDFDDLIMLTVKLFKENPATLEKYRKMFSSVLVDEFQDTNFAQYGLVKLLAGPKSEICAVGDDDQCIYGFRGARVQNVMDFEKDYPGATVIKLEQNYRSSPNILDVSGSVIEESFKRKPKKLWSEKKEGEKVYHCWFPREEEEAKHIVKTVKEHYLKGTYEYGDFAVLYRINLQSRPVEEALRREKIPYKVVGATGFFQRKEIKDITAYMRLALNHNDNVSLRRVINTPQRGIGASTLARIEQEAKKKSLSLYAAMGNVLKTSSLSPVAREKLGGFRDLVEEFSGVKYKDAGEMLKDIFIKSGYSSAIDEDRAENVSNLIASAEGRGIGDFLDFLSLVNNADDADSDNSVSLMTIHSAKGLEFPVVFVTGVEEGLLPHFKAESLAEVDEERRLLYVAMTRAKDLLWLTGARRRRIYSRTQDQEPSRFLACIQRHCVRIDTPAAAVPAVAIKKIKTFKAAFAYPVGTRVRHPKWGVGVVRDCYGDGDDQKITVNFPTIGIKRLALKFAHLEHIR